jgi:excinuclease ABC subunit A
MAQSRGWNAARFSFNVAGGRCEACRGLGEMALDMQYLPEQRIRCPHCGGRRFNAETLEVRYQNRSIADVLAMSIDEAGTFFADDPVLARGFGMLCAVGLGYLKLGEPTPNLSGGEAQRMRLAGELSRPHAGTLYVLDEPSTGLHARDIDVLIGVLDRLTAGRSTMLIIDHDPDIIANCDYVVDLGPGGGPDGGRIVAAGTPREIAASGSSVTGRYLRNHAAL